MIYWSLLFVCLNKSFNSVLQRFPSLPPCSFPRLLGKNLDNEPTTDQRCLKVPLNVSDEFLIWFHLLATLSKVPGSGFKLFPSSASGFPGWQNMMAEIPKWHGIFFYPHSPPKALAIQTVGENASLRFFLDVMFRDVFEAHKDLLRFLKKIEASEP